MADVADVAAEPEQADTPAEPPPEPSGGVAAAPFGPPDPSCAGVEHAIEAVGRVPAVRDAARRRGAAAEGAPALRRVVRTVSAAQIVDTLVKAALHPAGNGG